MTPPLTDAELLAYIELTPELKLLQEYFVNDFVRAFHAHEQRVRAEQIEAPPSQPAQGWRLVPVELLQLPPLTDAMYHAVRGLELEFSSGGPESVMASINDETLDEIWDAINTALRTSKAMLAPAPAAPTQAGAFKIGDTVTKVTGDYHLNAAPQAVLPPETKPDKTGRDAGDQQEAQPASAAPSAIATPKPTNGEGA